MRLSRLLPVVLILTLLTAGCGGNAAVQPSQPPAQPSAPSGPVTITIAIPDLTGSVFSDNLINAFEASHPNIKVDIVRVDASIPPAAQGLDKHLRAVQQYASAADVLYITNASFTATDTVSMSAEATRAGYFLDLKPFVDDDKTLNPDDFLPTVWQSYQWDGGIWAIPFAADPYILTYSPTAFDQAGLAYPDDKWTLNDLSQAIQKLSVKDASGKVTAPGIDVYGAQFAYLFRALLANSLIDTSAIPNTPKFDSPEVIALLQEWVKLDRDGMIGADFNKAPLNVTPAISFILRPSNSTDKHVATLLPGGKAMLNAQSFAVSRGTQYPKEAYTLAAWLTTRGDVANNALASTPARKSLVGTQSGDLAPFTLNIDPDAQAVIIKAIANAIPLSEMRYTDYLAGAYNNAKTNNGDVQVALQGAEDQAIKNQQAATDRKAQVSLVVATPIPVQQGTGKGRLKVAAVSYSLPNQDQWNKLIGDFTANDPEIGRVIFEKYLDATSLNQLGTALRKYDCVYAPFNGVTPAQIPRLLNLDPFLTADPAFDKADMIGGTLAQVTLDNKIWMLPSDLAPNVLKYDSERFAKAGIPEPGPTWTIEQFVDALKTFKSDGTGKPGFMPVNTFGSYLFPLIAAYGGNPIDYRTNPPTINFTDPATQDAIQQVVNLAKDGDFRYRGLFSTQMDVSFKPEPAPIRQSTLTAFTLPLPGSGADNDKTRVTLYPKGSKYAAITYNLGGFYISATAQNPAACYRFISKAARMPALFSAMPARRSLLTDSTLAATQGADTVALYKQIAALLDDPNTLIFPGISAGVDRVQIQLQLELFAALDKVILLNADLASSLKDAEAGAKAFQGCIASMPPLEVEVDKQRAYLNNFVDCAIKADPAMSPLYAGFKQK